MAALHRWVPCVMNSIVNVINVSLHLPAQVLVRAPTLLNLFPDLVQRRYTALKVSRDQR